MPLKNIQNPVIPTAQIPCPYTPYTHQPPPHPTYIHSGTPSHKKTSFSHRTENYDPLGSFIRSYSVPILQVRVTNLVVTVQQGFSIKWAEVPYCAWKQCQIYSNFLSFSLVFEGLWSATTYVISWGSLPCSSFAGSLEDFHRHCNSTWSISRVFLQGTAQFNSNLQKPQSNSSSEASNKKESWEPCCVNIHKVFSK